MEELYIFTVSGCKVDSIGEDLCWGSFCLVSHAVSFPQNDECIQIPAILIWQHFASYSTGCRNKPIKTILDSEHHHSVKEQTAPDLKDSQEQRFCQLTVLHYLWRSQNRLFQANDLFLKKSYFG